MSTGRAIAATIALLGATLALVSPTAAQQEPDLSAPVVGASDLALPGEVPAVAFLETFWADESGTCTGTLVDPEWVLTAAHCIMLEDGSHAEEIFVVLGSVDVGQDYYSSGPPAAGVEIHESDGWVIRAGASIGPDRWFDDLAMIHLSSPSAITPLQLTTNTSLTEPVDDEPSSRLRATFYGFGLHNCPPQCGPNGFDGLLRKGESTIYSDAFAADALGGGADGLSKKELNRNTFLFPNLELEGGGCFGDSGGAILVSEDNEWRIAGVNSFIVSRTLGQCDGFEGNFVGDLFILHAVADVVGTNMGNWVRSITSASETCAGQPVTIAGSNQADILVGTSGANVMDGRNGDDTIIGGGGPDTICGGADDDVIEGGRGRDTIRGQKGNDTIAGQAGRDNIRGGKGADDIYGGGAADEIRGNSGRDTIEGNKGSDLLRGNKGRDTLDGGPGSDTCFGGSGVDTQVSC